MAMQLKCFGVGRQLERPAGVVGRRVGDEQKRLALPLHVVVDQESVYVDAWHLRSLLAAGRASARRTAERGSSTARTSRMTHAKKFLECGKA
jgi:hypothetical protein